MPRLKRIDCATVHSCRAKLLVGQLAGRPPYGWPAMTRSDSSAPRPEASSPVRPFHGVARVSLTPSSPAGESSRVRCQAQAPELSAKSDGLPMVSASVEPSRLAGVRLLTASAGMAALPGAPGCAFHARVIQPLPAPWLPGVPRSRYSCASKWLRVTVVSRPQLLTMASLPSVQMSCRPVADGCRPKPVAAPLASVSGSAP